MRRARGDRESGSTLLVTMVVLSGMIAVSGLAIFAVQSQATSAGADRFQLVALYSAESGAWAGVDYLRDHCDTSQLFTPLVSPGNTAPVAPAEVHGNDRRPGDEQNPFDPRLRAWYQVSFLNNLGDKGLALGLDTDSQLVVHSVGHGPDGTQVTIEVEVRNDVCLAAYCDSDYAQQGLAPLNSAGFSEDSPCASDVTSSETRSFDP